MKKIWEKIKSCLIDNWQQAWKLASVWVTALLLTLDVAFDYLPTMQQYVGGWGTKVAALAIIAARLIRQTPAKPKQESTS